MEGQGLYATSRPYPRSFHAKTYIRAERFNVTLPFLLQQAAWLFEQQLSQVKEQLRKASRPTSIGTLPTPGSASGSGIKGGYEMARGVSGGKSTGYYFSCRTDRI